MKGRFQDQDVLHGKVRREARNIRSLHRADILLRHTGLERHRNRKELSRWNIKPLPKRKICPACAWRLPLVAQPLGVRRPKASSMLKTFPIFLWPSMEGKQTTTSSLGRVIAMLRWRCT